MWETILKMFLILFFAQTAITLVLFWLLRRFYIARFDKLAEVIQEAMALRDAQILRLKAQLSEILVRDTGFDALNDFSDLVPDEDEASEKEPETKLEVEGEIDEREGESV